MSSLKDNLSEKIKTAMKARELETVKVLRNVQAVIKQIEIDRQITLDDNGVLEILQNKPNNAKNRWRFLPPMGVKIWLKKSSLKLM